MKISEMLQLATKFFKLFCHIKKIVYLQTADKCLFVVITY